MERGGWRGGKMEGREVTNFESVLIGHEDAHQSGTTKPNARKCN